MVDLVIPVREGPNEELRFALRSIAENLAVDRVWLVGHRPDWATNVEHLQTVQAGGKWSNAALNVRVACEHPDIPDPFLLSMDDVFVLERVESMPVLHRGPVTTVLADNPDSDSPYVAGMRATLGRLREVGHTDPVSFELHVPLPVAKMPMLAALDLGSDIPVFHKRTAYGALAGIAGTFSPDCKIAGRRNVPQLGQTFVSTTDDSFSSGQVGRWLRDRFPEACRYER